MRSLVGCWLAFAATARAEDGAPAGDSGRSAFVRPCRSQDYGGWTSCRQCHGQGGIGGAGGRWSHGPVDRRAVDNPTALFGAGLLDAVTEEVLVRLAAQRDPAHPEIAGRVAGRFGWQGQYAHLADAVRAELYAHGGACEPVRQPETLTAFVADLPQPVVRDVPGAARGREVFVAIGCAACHVPDVGEAIGVYSDLLLHDLGETTMWRGFRTAPLWGLRDSAPYLHDGGAPTVRDAIAAHWGEADKVRAAWAALPDADAAALSAFLTALTAPDPGPGPALIPSRGAR